MDETTDFTLHMCHDPRHTTFRKEKPYPAVVKWGGFCTSCQGHAEKISPGHTTPAGQRKTLVITYTWELGGYWMSYSMDLVNFICSTNLGHISSPKALWENLSCTWRAPYVLEFPSYNLGGILCLLIGVRTLPLLRSRPDIPPIHMPRDQHRFLFTISIAPRSMIHTWSPWVGGQFPKCRPVLSYLLPRPRPLILRMPPS
jgi:hypothetical protein